MQNRGLIIKKKFDASHFIKNHQGGCANMHGHTYHVDFHFNFKDQPLNKLNMLFDFKEIDYLLDHILKEYDHHCINGMMPYGTYVGGSNTSIEGCFKTLNNPTAEYMAEILFEQTNNLLKETLQLTYNGLYRIIVWETDKYAATYEEV